ncbi:MAG: lipoyl synthase, partial [Candidatus Saganbacteria bacterium]|nr:lipoyl synthase [Candidatus Saganbacteria bacterium]
RGFPFHRKVEVLIPDFQGNFDALNIVLAANPDVLNHNVETVPRLYPTVRPQANYQRSLDVLRHAKEQKTGICTKSGFMVGLGEREAEVIALLRDLRDTGCEIVTIGQYLAPSPAHLPVQDYISPETFEQYRKTALELGFLHAESGPFVRSSYHAERVLNERKSR